jgi:hypothetical protein
MADVDHVGEAVRKLRAAQAGVPKAEERAREIIAAARSRVEEARVDLAAAIVADYRAGARVSDLARRAEYNRETIRRILRAGGVEPE